ncbi:MAG: hypothetical protein DRO40_13235 [Thermoprotei archaeon]|nr:MAG: hypothetical protein DRO40_13235 [Thermoprotei archaeon]
MKREMVSRSISLLSCPVCGGDLESTFDSERNIVISNCHECDRTFHLELLEASLFSTLFRLVRVELNGLPVCIQCGRPVSDDSYCPDCELNAREVLISIVLSLPRIGEKKKDLELVYPE